MGSIEGQETHVLMVALPFQGHLNPMLKFAKHLARTNLHFTLATIESARDLLSSTDEPHSLVDLVFFSDGLPKDDPRDHEPLTESLRKVGANNFSKIIEGKRFDASSLCLLLHGFQLLQLLITFLTNSFPDLEDPNQKVELPGLPFLEVRDLPTLMLPSHGAIFNTLMAEFVECLKDVKWVLANSFYELESVIIESMFDLKPIIPIGPLVSPFLLGADEDKILDGKSLDMWKADDYCMEWLDKQVRSSVFTYLSEAYSNHQRIKSRP
ncbi:hypothetical protein AtEden1_Chr2g0242431 [Arabidopsis thaliana]